MGRWLDALKKRENAPDANPQKYQKSDMANFDTFETAGFMDLQKNSDPKKITETAPDGADKTDNTSQMVVSSVLSVPTGSENENCSGDQRPTPEGEKREEPLFSVTLHRKANGGELSRSPVENGSQTPKSGPTTQNGM